MSLPEYKISLVAGGGELFFSFETLKNELWQSCATEHVLSSLLLVIYDNEFDDNIGDIISKFADDIKIGVTMESEKDKFNVTIMFNITTGH